MRRRNVGHQGDQAGRLVTIVDINPDSIALAQEYFSLPGQVTCHVEDGATFLERYQLIFDAIVIDAFTMTAFQNTFALRSSFAWSASDWIASSELLPA
jgi:spermidine synthase